MVDIHDGLSSLADRYDGFIVDLWGVLHDGVRAYPAAVACLEALRRHGKGIFILSNAPRRAEVIRAANARLGIAPALCDGVVSSGEDAWRHLADRPDPWYRALGRRCHHLGPARDLGMREGLDYVFVDRPGEADFMLVTGALDGDDTVGRYDPFLQEARGRAIPMVCANPDLEVMRGPQMEICAGAIARRYQELGGEVRYHGKPHAGVYEACFALSDGIERGRLAAIGDSLRTDIAGAAAVGIDGIFITGGVQGKDLGVDAQGRADPARLAALCKAEGHNPTAALPVLRW